MISASAESSGYPTTNFYNFGHYDDNFFKTWCTTDFDQNPFIEMTLTAPVLITKILSSGRTSPSESYFVTNFTLEYSLPNSTNNLTYYTTETGSIKVALTRLIKLQFYLVIKLLLEYNIHYQYAAFYGTSVEHTNRARETVANTKTSSMAN